MDDQQELAARSENEAVNNARTETIMSRRKKPRDVAIGPGGVRVDVTPHMKVRYNSPGQTEILGRPESIVSEDFQREHPGWHYAWPVRSANETTAYIRAGWYKPVPFEQIDSSNPMAAIADIVTPAGKYVVWKQHILVAIPPDKWEYLVTQYESMAWSRTVRRGAQVEDELDAQFGRGGYKAEVNAFTDQRTSRTGD